MRKQKKDDIHSTLRKQYIYTSQNIIRQNRTRRMRWTENVLHVER
jgi:hypothetical protein